MSVFTNSLSDATGNAQAYTTAVLALLGTRDPLAVLRSTPAELRRTLSAMTGAQLTQPEAPDKWSVGQVVQHLADTELATGWRIRLVLAQDRPPLTGYDQDAWAQRLHYDRADPGQALEEFEAFRRSTLRLVEQASPADLQRVGIHVERGEQTVDLMIRMSAGHDLLHLHQVERIRMAIGLPGGRHDTDRPGC